MNLPTLSVVVPNYNHAHYLPECLKALLEQSVEPIEIIVIDDCSTDNSIAVLEEIRRKHPRIMFCRNEKNMGVMQTLNKGLAMCRGEYVFFPGADDVVLPGMFEKSLKIFAEHPTAGLCFSDPASVDHATGHVNETKLGLNPGPAYFTPEELTARLAANKRILLNGLAMMKRSVLVAAGGFVPEFKWHADFFFAYMAAFRHGACYVPDRLCMWRATPGSFMTVGMRTWSIQQAVVRGMLDRLHSPEYRDVLPYFERSGVMGLAPRASLIVLLHRRYWSFINFTFLRRAVPNDVFWALPHWLQRIIRRALGKLNRSN